MGEPTRTRRRRSTRAFLADVLKKASDPDHPAHFLVEKKVDRNGQVILKNGEPVFELRKTIRVAQSTGRVQSGRYPGSETGPIMQVGHATAFVSGAAEVLLIEDPDLNALSNAVAENRKLGIVTRKGGYIIGGLPFEEITAKQYVKLGYLDGAVLRNAPRILGPDLPTVSAVQRSTQGNALVNGRPSGAQRSTGSTPSPDAPKLPKKLSGFVAGPHPGVSLVFELSGAKQIVDGLVDDVSDLVHGTGRKTPVDRAVQKAAPAIEAEFEFLEQRARRLALWAAYESGEQLYAEWIVRVTAIGTQATLGVIGVGTKFSHSSIFSIVPQLMPYYVTKFRPPTVGEADDQRTSGVTNENRARLERAGLYKGSRGLVGNEFTPEPFMDARSAQVLLYSVHKRVDLAALRAGLGPLTGAWSELSVRSRRYGATPRRNLAALKSAAMETDPSRERLVDGLQAEYVFRDIGTGLVVRGRRRHTAEDGTQSALEKYDVQSVVWDENSRSLHMTCDANPRVRLRYDLRQIDESVMVGKVYTSISDDTTGQRIATLENLVVFRRPPGFNMMHNLQPNFDVTNPNSKQPGEAKIIKPE